jgi:hypothetical protein
MIDKRRMGAACAAALVLLGVAACSSGGDHSTTSSTNLTNAANCPTWTDKADPLDPYSPPLARAGMGGAFTFTLLGIDPPPPATGTSTWTIQITDAKGQPVTDATITDIKAVMPQHGHPTTAVPQPSSNGDGTYSLANMYLFMGGVWQVTITAQECTTGDAGQSCTADAGTSDAGQSDAGESLTIDSATFTFCLGT